MIKKPMSMTAGGWTAWCQSVRALPKQTRDPAPHKPSDPKTQVFPHAS
jgi:hypothetical protein